jgi:hypothetical protein
MRVLRGIYSFPAWLFLRMSTLYFRRSIGSYNVYKGKTLI